MDYDYLMVATGATHSYFGHDDWAEYAPGLKSIEDAIEIRRRVLLAFELAERQMLETGSHPPLNFVVIGGGPTGVELAGAISDIAKLYMRHDFRHIDPSKARVFLIEGGPRILAAYPEILSRKAVEQLTALGVEVHTGVAGYRRKTWIRDGRGPPPRFSRDPLGRGRSGLAAGQLFGFETDKRGGIFVNQTLNPPGHPEIFICGDLAHLEQDGKPIPGSRPARNADGRPRRKNDRAGSGPQAALPVPLLRQGRHGHHRTHGRRRPHQWPFRANWSGFPGMGHLAHRPHLLPVGFRNRIAVLMDWVWNYFTFTYGARLITGSDNLPGWAQQQGVKANGRPHPSTQPHPEPAQPLNA